MPNEKVIMQIARSLDYDLIFCSFVIQVKKIPYLSSKIEERNN